MIKLSRSAVEKFINCKRCFVLQYKFKVSPPSLPFTLNNAVDELCKIEFDTYRMKQKPHPLFLKHNIDAIPFKHSDIDKWRDFRKGGVSYIDEKKGYHFYGAIDDVWVNKKEELIVADVKSTSKKKFNWDETWAKYDYPKGYKRQLEMYQWLLRKNGFSVSNKAYLLYFNGLKYEKEFNQTLKFESFSVELECSDNWVEEKVIQAKKQLESDTLPRGEIDCDNCRYIKKRSEAVKK